MSTVSLPIHVLQNAELMIRSKDTSIDLSALSFSMRFTVPAAIPQMIPAHVNVKVGTAHDASGTYLSISFGDNDNVAIEYVQPTSEPAPETMES